MKQSNHSPNCTQSIDCGLFAGPLLGKSYLGQGSKSKVTPTSKAKPNEFTILPSSVGRHSHLQLQSGTRMAYSWCRSGRNRGCTPDTDPSQSWQPHESIRPRAICAVLADCGRQALQPSPRPKGKHTRHVLHKGQKRRVNVPLILRFPSSYSNPLSSCQVLSHRHTVCTANQSPNNILHCLGFAGFSAVLGGPHVSILLGLVHQE